MTAPHRYVCTLAMSVYWSNQSTGSCNSSYLV